MTGRYTGWIPATETPTLAEAVAAGAIAAATTPEEWTKLTPGMRREIVRTAKAKRWTGWIEGACA
jgi:hypothetical protein